MPWDQETYVIFLALQKWESFIGLQPVLVLTDHQAIDSWMREILDPPVAHLADVLGGMSFFLDLI